MACMFVDTYVDTRNMAGIQTTYCMQSFLLSQCSSRAHNAHTHNPLAAAFNYLILSPFLDSFGS